MVGRDAGPSFAGGRSTALLEAEFCALLLHLSFCTITPHGPGKDFLTML